MLICVNDKFKNALQIFAKFVQLEKLVGALNQGPIVGKEDNYSGFMTPFGPSLEPPTSFPKCANLANKNNTFFYSYFSQISPSATRIRPKSSTEIYREDS